MSITLSTNTVLTGLSNFILNLRTDDHPMGEALKYYNMFGRDVEPYGDKFRILNSEAVPTYSFSGSSDANHDLLDVCYPAQNEQVISLDTSRQIVVSIERFFSKQAAGSLSVYSELVSNLTSWLDDTFAIYMGAISKVKLGTATRSGKGAQTVTLLTDIKTPGTTPAYYTGADLEAIKRQNASLIAKKIADIKNEMKDVRTDYNTLGYHRTCDNPVIIWNENFAELVKSYLPTIYHLPDFNFENTMPAKYFGALNATTTSLAGDIAATEFTVGSGSSAKHYFPGDAVSTGSTVVANSCLTPDESLVCIICDPEAPIFVKGEKVTTAFNNPQNLIENNYLTWMYGFGIDNGKAFVKLDSTVA